MLEGQRFYIDEIGNSYSYELFTPIPLEELVAHEGETDLTEVGRIRCTDTIEGRKSVYDYVLPRGFKYFFRQNEVSGIFLEEDGMESVIPFDEVFAIAHFDPSVRKLVVATRNSEQAMDVGELDIYDDPYTYTVANTLVCADLQTTWGEVNTREYTFTLHTSASALIAEPESKAFWEK